MRRPVIDDSEQPGNMLLLTDIPERERNLIQFGQLSQICPIIRFDHVTNNMTNTVCAICLDDFKEDYYVRVLPCHHGYCTACIGKFNLIIPFLIFEYTQLDCIDVWLTKKSSLCPFCKYDCRLALEDHTKKDECVIELQTMSHAQTLASSNEDAIATQNASNVSTHPSTAAATTVVDHVSQVEHR
jgi:hypothetical protein